MATSIEIGTSVATTLSRQQEPTAYVAGFTKRSWDGLRDQENGSGLVQPVEVAAPQTVVLPPLAVDERFFEQMKVVQRPEGFLSRQFYKSAPVEAFQVPRALVHGCAGIIAIAPYVVTTSLGHTAPSRDFYEIGDDGTITLLSKSIRTLSGTSYSILSGGFENYYHWMLDSVARLSALKNLMQRRPGRLLVPPLGNAFRRQSLALVDWLPSDCLLEIGPGDTVFLEHLVAPGSVTNGGWFVSPKALPIFEAMATARGFSAAWPRRFYIDRSNAGNRKMLNEADLVDSLRECGIVPISLEALTIAEQIQLFSQAELVVASHGAGLTNLLFVPATCCVVEIFMSTYVNWCFRVLASVKQVRYQPVVCKHTRGRDNIHGEQWAASIPHVLKAIHECLSG